MPLVYSDDTTIADAEYLWRRIHPSQITTNADNTFRVSSAAFKDSELSVVIESVAHASGRTYREILAGYPTYGLVSITAGCARNQGQAVVRDPIEAEPAHGLVVGHKTTTIARNLARQAVWIVDVPGNRA